MVGQYRAAMAEHVGEWVWKCMVKRLKDASPAFAELWRQHDVSMPENLTKRLEHPDLGILRFRYTNLWLSPRVGIRLITYLPEDEEPRSKMSSIDEVKPRPLYPALGSTA